MRNKPNVLITGSSSGFGLLTSRTLLDRGYTVFATMRSLEGKNAATAAELKGYADGKAGKAHFLELDVTSDASVDAAFQKALELEGHIDVVVNNAGYGVGGLCEGVPTEQFQRQFDVNVFGVQRVSRAVLPSMRKQRAGLLINISSVMGRIVLPFATPYTASKYALEGLSESYRYELAGTGVDVVIVEPGGFGTSFMSNMDNAADTARVESYGPLAELPEKMWGGMGEMLHGEGAPNPQAVADAVLGLIETPAGERPLRTVVDPMMGGEAPTQVNRTTDEIQQQMFGSMDMENLLSVKRPPS